MKQILLILTGVIIFFTANAQQSPYYSNYHFNKYLINPAVAGSENLTQLHLIIKSYFIGFGDKNPGTQSLSLNTSMNEFGLGVQILNDSYGNTRKTGLGLTYAYHLDLGNAGYLSSGLTPKFYQFSINQENYFYFDNNDDVISNAKEGKMVFDIDFGLYFYNDNYYAGFSALNLLESNLNFGSNNSDDNRMLRDFLIMGGYNLSLTDNIEITPSFLAGFNSAASYIDIGAKALIKDMIWAGLSYKSINTLSFMAGVKYQKYYLGYAFDYSMNDISKYTSGTHEILMGINFGKIQNTARL